MADEHPIPRVFADEPDARLRARMRHFYRDAADYEAQVAAHDERYFRKYVGTMLRFVPPEIDTVLELGAGSGAALSGFIEEREPGSVVGLELSRTNLAAILSRGAPHVAVGGDALELPFADASFDWAVFTMVLHEMALATRLGVLTEVVRVLSPEGRILVVDYHDAKVPWRGWLLKASILTVERAAGGAVPRVDLLRAHTAPRLRRHAARLPLRKPTDRVRRRLRRLLRRGHLELGPATPRPLASLTFRDPRARYTADRSGPRPARSHPSAVSAAGEFACPDSTKSSTTSTSRS